MRSINDLKTKQIVSNIRKIREFRNYTQDYLSAKLRISQNAYSKIELGYSNVTLNRLIEIAEILEVELADLLCLDGEETIIPKLSGQKLKQGGGSL
ncbi:helix-turn-helix domain-containing protein [Mucilaginibacter sp.]|uniref:helix-turn-helix domain-containing protein n=1 Tax=Mucilaginibacter sp. TaxID=1882438 RepID=UPI002604CF42|nr:helix-turn-helix transcriptional regulator [Mucilaginibacter sp.]MDB4920616.1 transcriptional regulator [Mucilaginibacter sp.]